VYLRNRYYSPGTGRFNTMDPIGSSGGHNLYGYCGGDPVNRTDPTGTYWMAVFHGIRNKKLDIGYVWVDDETNEVSPSIPERIQGTVPREGSLEYNQAVKYFLEGYHKGQFYRWQWAANDKWKRSIDEKMVDPTLSRLEKGVLGFYGAGRIAQERMKKYPMEITKGVAEWYIGAGVFKVVGELANAAELGINVNRYAQAAFREGQALKAARDVQAAAALENTLAGTLERGNIAKNIVGGVPSGHAGHHLITIAEANQYSVMKRAAELGYDINRGANGIALPRTVALAEETGNALHSGRHISEYTNFVSGHLQKLDYQYRMGHLADKDLIKAIAKVENAIREAVKTNKVRLQYVDPNFIPK